MITALILSFALAFAEDELTTTTQPVLNPDAKPAASKPTVAASVDPALRAQVRRRAPFWIEHSAHGAPIRLNKDGTFTSEAGGGGSIAGNWKALKGDKLQINWGDGGESYTYPVKATKAQLLIQGRAPKKNRYILD